MGGVGDRSDEISKKGKEKEAGRTLFLWLLRNSTLLHCSGRPRTTGPMLSEVYVRTQARPHQMVNFFISF